jgi:SAM-dependent methyltransferase
MSGNYLKEVRNQYEEFPYPPVNPEDEKHRLIIPFNEVFSFITHYCFAGKKDMRRNCRFLVAGGGTGDAAIGIMEQLMHGGENSEVVYVDISSASLDIAKKRARIRGFEDKIIWKQGSLLSVAEMDIGTFDYINSSGVLHHLADPAEGLKALVSVLKPDGILCLMLYAKYGRMAVYQMQESLRLVNQNTSDTQQKIENTKTILDALPETNWLIASPETILSEIQGGDAALYDLLLHSQDRAYSVPEIYDFIETQQLEIIEFFADDFTLGGSIYNPGLYIKDDNLLKQVKTLPIRNQQALAELLHSKICKHTFYAARKARPAVSFDDPDMVPYFDVSFTQGIYEKFRNLVSISEGIIPLKSNDGAELLIVKTPHLEYIAKYLDGQRTVEEICTAAQSEIGDISLVKLKAELKAVYKSLNRYRYMLLRHKNIPPYLLTGKLQERVNQLYA